MEINLAEKRLYDAAAMGDEKALRELLQEDPLLLDRVSYTCPNKTPLHVATMKGHLGLVQEILNTNLELAEELDSHNSSALHIASAKGYEEIARILSSVAPDMCMSRDCQGRNPLHVAAMKGCAGVLRELVQAAPIAAREKVDRGLTVLHLCVKHNQLEALKVLVQKLDDILNWKDDDGDTILHMAVKNKQIQIVEYLVKSTTIDVYAKNSKGQTALAMSEQTPPNKRNSELRKILSPTLHNPRTDTQPEKWLTKKRDAIMVVAILIATMAFQAGVTPAGGVWQDDSSQVSNGNPLYRAGESVMAYHHPKFYKSFIRANTIAFVSSLSTILLLISGLPFRKKLFMWILMMIMWLTVTSIAVTYTISISAVTPGKDRKSLSHVTKIGVVVWCAVMGILLVGNTVRLIDKWLKNKGIIVWRPRQFRSLVDQGKYENGSQESV